MSVRDFCRVLLVEDDLGDARLVAEMLRDADTIDVALVRHSLLADAVEPASLDIADLILLDLTLPDAEGLEGLRRVRTLAPDVPVVVLSGLSDENIAMQAVQLGAQDYLVKGDVDGTRLTRAIRYAVERKRAEIRLARLALHDPLTGLPNRLLLDDRLGHALTRRRTNGQVALLFIDLDGFKAVNDAHGHAAGDELLVQVAERLREGLRAGDTVARMGGDEFVVLCEDVADVEATIALADRIALRLADPYLLSAGRVEISAAVGVAVAGEEDAPSLLRRADAAMYAAKRSGGSAWRMAEYDVTAVTD
jgi:two-component system cell cycle response regulator